MNKLETISGVSSELRTLKAIQISKRLYGSGAINWLERDTARHQKDVLDDPRSDRHSTRKKTRHTRAIKGILEINRAINEIASGRDGNLDNRIDGALSSLKTLREKAAKEREDRKKSKGR